MNGEVVLETPEALLRESDLWEVGTVNWVAQEVTAADTDDGGLIILNDYSNPYDQ